MRSANTFSGSQAGTLPLGMPRRSFGGRATSQMLLRSETSAPCPSSDAASTHSTANTFCVCAQVGCGVARCDKTNQAVTFVGATHFMMLWPPMSCIVRWLKDSSVLHSGCSARLLFHHFFRR